jgi:hypothetical protein
MPPIQIGNAESPLHRPPKPCNAEELRRDAACEQQRHGFDWFQAVKQHGAGDRLEGESGEARRQRTEKNGEEGNCKRDRRGRDSTHRMACTYDVLHARRPFDSAGRE